PPGPQYQQMGRIDGKTIYEIIEHPALIYETLASAGSLWKKLFNPNTLGDLELTVFLRFAFSAFEWLTWGLLFIGLAVIKPTWKNGREERCFYLALLLTMSWPGSLLNTTNINIDATVGVLTTGLVCTSVLLFRNPNLTRWPLFALLFFGSFFFGFGKNELSLVFILALLAIGFVVMLGRYFKVLLGWREAVAILIVALIGNLAGNLFNYSFDPINYQAGWGILNNRSSQASLFETKDFGAWLLMTIERLPFFSLHLLYWNLIGCALWRTRRAIDFHLLFYFVFSSALFFGFFFSHSEVGSRYFEPSLIAFIFGFVLAFPLLDLSGRYNRAFIIVALIISVHATVEIGSTIFRQMKNPTLQQTRFVLPEEVLQVGCIPLLEQADVFNRPEIDYAAYTGLAKKFENAGKKICPIRYTNR
ncbi:MAG TPA: hypothetical protein VN631_13560, partial [Negativicutes bacterium]|nr:hypothetical protein [Negativicutes bacterium]